jgi:hypothetical protein
MSPRWKNSALLIKWFNLHEFHLLEKCRQICYYCSLSGNTEVIYTLWRIIGFGHSLSVNDRVYWSKLPPCIDNALLCGCSGWRVAITTSMQYIQCIRKVFRPLDFFLYENLIHLSAQPRQCQSGLGTNLWISLSGPRQSTDLNPIEHLWRELKITVQQCSPSNLTEPQRICREEWQKLPKYMCAKLVASYPRLEAVIAAKGALSNYQCKYLCKCKISVWNCFYICKNV